MRQISALMLLGAAIAISAPLGAGGRVEQVQAQNQAPPEGFRIIGNIYWVGGEYGSYLITTPQGHILHDTGTNEMHDVIVSNVKKVGFDVKDIKMIISSHAHFDHVQGHAAMKKLTGAQVVALGGDAAALEAGQDNSAGGFSGMVAVHVDRVIKDGETISLGGVTLRALWVPGHTQGATVWMTTVSEGDRKYSVAFRGGETPNAGVQLIGNPRHPRVIEETRMTLQRMKALQPPDLFLHNHRQNLGRPLNPALPVNPLCVTCMDAEAFKAMVANAEAAFAGRVREAEAQQKTSPQPAAPQGPQPYFVGNRIGLPINPAPDGAFTPASANVKVFGAIYAAESCSYDGTRGVIVVPNRGVAQNVQTNNAWVSLINHDGSVHTARWIGIQNPGEQRTNMTPPLVLNEPFGSDIANGMLYVADRDGGTTPADTAVSVIRRFNMQTGAPAGEVRVEKSTGFNDIEVADDGTIYATQTGVGGQNPDATTWQVWKITRDGAASILVQGAPLRQPNGIAFDPQGNIVVVNIGDTAVLTFSPDGKLMRTENAALAGNDGLVIMPDGTKYVSSVTLGGVSRIRPGQPAELIAQNIPNPASMCYDAGANQLVIPMNANNGLAFISLR